MTKDPNYFADRNPFQLAKPPAWWLRGVYRFDPDLVLIPSRRQPLFVVARRRRLSRAIGAIVDRKLGLADPGNTLHSVMCDAYECVYVTTVMCTGAWTTGNLHVFLDELRRRDTWQDGGPLDEQAQRKALFEGGSALAKRIDAQDEADRARLNRQVRDDLYHATGDAWRSRQARVGERVLNAGRPTTRIRRIATPKPLPVRPLIGV